MKYFLLSLLLIIFYNTYAQSVKVSETINGMNQRTWYVGTFDDLSYYIYYKGLGGTDNSIVGINENGKKVYDTPLSSKENYIHPLYIKDGKATCVVSVYKNSKSGPIVSSSVLQQIDLSNGKPVGEAINFATKVGWASGEFGIYFGESICSANNEWSVYPTTDKDGAYRFSLINNSTGVVKSTAIKYNDNPKELWSEGSIHVKNNGDIYFVVSLFDKYYFKRKLIYIQANGAYKFKDIDLPNQKNDIELNLDEQESIIVTYTTHSDVKKLYRDVYGFIKYNDNLEVLDKSSVNIGSRVGDLVNAAALSRQGGVPGLTPVGTYFREDNSIVVVTQQQGSPTGEPTYTNQNGAIIIFILSEPSNKETIKVIPLQQQHPQTGSLGCSVLQQNDDLFFFRNTDFKPDGDIMADFVVQVLNGKDISEPKLILKDSPNNVDVHYEKVSDGNLVFETWTGYDKFGVIRVKM